MRYWLKTHAIPSWVASPLVFLGLAWIAFYWAEGTWTVYLVSLAFAIALGIYSRRTVTITVIDTIETDTERTMVIHYTRKKRQKRADETPPA